jgi:hypothetical protein
MHARADAQPVVRRGPNDFTRQRQRRAHGGKRFVKRGHHAVADGLHHGACLASYCLGHVPQMFVKKPECPRIAQFVE